VVASAVPVHPGGEKKALPMVYEPMFVLGGVVSDVDEVNHEPPHVKSSPLPPALIDELSVELEMMEPMMQIPHVPVALFPALPLRVRAFVSVWSRTIKAKSRGLSEPLFATALAKGCTLTLKNGTVPRLRLTVTSM
jgi:hypothetical protein